MKIRSVDRWLVEARETFDMKRKELYHPIHAQIATDLPYIFLYCPDELVAIHKRFRGREVAPLGLAWNFREWWVPKDEQRYQTVDYSDDALSFPPAAAFNPDPARHFPDQFFLMQLAPGGPIDQMADLNPHVTPAVKARD